METTLFFSIIFTCSRYVESGKILKAFKITTSKVRKMKLKKLVIPIVIGTLLVGCSTEQSTDNKGQTERQEEKAKETSSNKTKTENSKEVLLEKKYFNEVEEVDGQQVIKNVDNILILVNKESALLPEG